MPIVLHKDLYNLVKLKADTIYEKPSAYKSGYIVKEYKRLGGRYKEDNEERGLQRWFKEKWQDVGFKDYPVYRPMKIIDKKKTPLTVFEIDKKNLQKQIKLKQIIRGTKNLPPFIPLI